jgi:hypothetical protein
MLINGKNVNALYVAVSATKIMTGLPIVISANRVEQSALIFIHGMGVHALPVESKIILITLGIRKKTFALNVAFPKLKR